MLRLVAELWFLWGMKNVLEGEKGPGLRRRVENDVECVEGRRKGRVGNMINAKGKRRAL